jgi:hypothetical protein
MASQVIYCTQREKDRLLAGQWSKALVRKADKQLGLAGCPYCGGGRMRLARCVLLVQDESGLEPIQTLVISSACVDCRAVEPINCEVGPPPEAFETPTAAGDRN